MAPNAFTCRPARPHGAVLFCGFSILLFAVPLAAFPPAFDAQRLPREWLLTAAVLTLSVFWLAGSLKMEKGFRRPGWGTFWTVAFLAWVALEVARSPRPVEGLSLLARLVEFCAVGWLAANSGFTTGRLKSLVLTVGLSGTAVAACVLAGLKDVGFIRAHFWDAAYLPFLANFMIVAFPLTCLGAFSGRSPAAKLFWLAGSALIVASILALRLWPACLGLALTAGGVAGFSLAAKKGCPTAWKTRAAVFAAVAGLALACFVCSDSSPKILVVASPREALRSETFQTYWQWDRMKVIWSAARGVIAENPAFGQGAGGFAAAFPGRQEKLLELSAKKKSGSRYSHPYKMASMPQTPQNLLLRVIAEFGLTGLLLGLAAFCGAIGGFRSLGSSSVGEEEKSLRFFALAGVGAWLVVGLYGQPFENAPVGATGLFLLGVLRALGMKEESVEGRFGAPAFFRPPKPGYYLAMFAALVFAMAPIAWKTALLADDLLLKRASRWADAGEPGVAALTLEHASRTFPWLEKTRFCLGQAYALDGQFGAAADALAKVADGRWAGPAFALRADALRSLHKPAEAEPAYRWALKIDPGRAESWAGLADALADLDRPEEAEGRARTALALAPDLPGALIALAKARFKLGKRAEAHETLDRVLAAHPDSAAALYRKGLFFMEEGDLRKAANLFRQVTVVAPKSEEARFAFGHLDSFSAAPPESSRP